jgi:FtsH-binding integral membrane protein
MSGHPLLVAAASPPSTIALLLTMGSVIACSVLAAKKGRNRIIWSLAGFLFTFLAVLAIALLPARRPRPEEG